MSLAAFLELAGPYWRIPVAAAGVAVLIGFACAVVIVNDSLSARRPSFWREWFWSTAVFAGAFVLVAVLFGLVFWAFPKEWL